MAGEVTLGGFSGYDTQAMVDALVASQRAGLERLQARKTKLTATQTAWNSISGRLGVLGTAATGLSTAASAATLSVSSSDSSKVSVSGTPRSPVALSLGVSQLARGSVYAVDGFSSGSSAIGPGVVSLSRGLAGIGVTTASAQSASGVALEVTQASASAKLAVANFPVVVGSGETLDLALTSASSAWSASLSVPEGTYATAAELDAALAPLLSGAPVKLVQEQGTLVLASKDQGSAVTLTASGALASALGASAATGRDAIVTSGAVETVVSSLTAGGSISVSTDSGSVSLVVGSTGGLTVGSASLSSYTFASDASLEDVASALNSAQSKFNATVVGTGTSTELIVASRDTGASTNVDLSWSGFTAGSVTQIGLAQDANITVGSRVYTRESNVVTDLIAGATVTLNAVTGSSEVVLTSQSSPDRLLASAKTFVTAFNDTLNAIGSATAANPTNPAQAGPLASDSTARMLRRELVGSLNQVLGTGTYDRLTSIGMSMSRAGQLTLDDAIFRKAVSSAPGEVASLLTRSLSGAPSWVTLKTASPTLAAGSYEVAVTTAPTRATVQSNEFAELLTQETLTVTLGSSSVTATLPVASTPQTAAELLNARFSSAGLPALATSSAGRLLVSSTAFGSAASLSIASPLSSIGFTGLSATGSDAAGSIAGEAATGSGSQLSVSTGSASGLSLEVTATPADVAGAGGTLIANVTYQPGLASLIRASLDRISGQNGTVSNAQSSISSALRRLDDNVARAERLADLAESRIRRQFAALESAVAMLRSSVPNFPSLPSSGQS